MFASLFSSLASKLALFGAAFLIVFGLFVWGKYESARADAANQRNVVLMQDNKANVTALATMKKQYEEAVAVAAQLATQRQALSDQLATIHNGVSHVPNGNKPVSPAVGFALGQLLSAPNSNAH